MGTTMERLPCKLTPDELQMRALGMIDCMREKVRLQEEKASLSADIRERIKANDKKTAELAQQYESGKVWREVEVETTRDFEHNVVRKVRTDTNEVLELRAMTAAERQGELNLAGPGEGDDDVEDGGDPDDLDDDEEDDEPEAPQTDLAATAN